MAALSALLEADRLNARRAASARGPWRSGDALMLGIVGVLFAFVELVLAASAWVLLGMDPHATWKDMSTQVLGRQALSGCLLLLFAAWLLLPLFARGLLVRGRGMPLPRLLQHPLRARELLAFSAVSALRAPAYSALALLSVACLAPLMRFEHRLAAAAGGLLFLVAAASLAWSVGLASSALLSVRQGRALALGLTSALLLVVWLPLLVDARLSAEGLEAHGLGAHVLLLSRDGTRGFFPVLWKLAPGSALVRLATIGPSVGSFAHLLGLAALGVVTASLAFRRVLFHAPVLGSRSTPRLLSAPPVTSLPFLRDPLRALAEKELAYLLQTMDAGAVTLLALMGAAFVLAGPARWSATAVAMLPFMAVNQLAMPCNAFGLDRGGIDRYLLAPVTAREVLLSKNVAWWWLSALQCLPLVVALGVRHGAALACATLLGQAAYVMLLTWWGNGLSVRSPAPREFWNFDSSAQVGGATSVAFGLVTAAGLLGTGAVAHVVDSLGPGPPVVLPAVMLLALLAALAAWRAGLGLSAAAWVEHHEDVRARLTA